MRCNHETSLSLQHNISFEQNQSGFLGALIGLRVPGTDKCAVGERVVCSTQLHESMLTCILQNKLINIHRLCD